MHNLLLHLLCPQDHRSTLRHYHLASVKRTLVFQASSTTSERGLPMQMSRWPFSSSSSEMAKARSWSISPSRHFCIHVVHVPLRQSYGRRRPASSASSRMYSSSATSTVTPLFLNVTLCILAIS